MQIQCNQIAIYGALPCYLQPHMESRRGPPAEQQCQEPGSSRTLRGVCSQVAPFLGKLWEVHEEEFGVFLLPLLYGTSFSRKTHLF